MASPCKLASSQHGSPGQAEAAEPHGSRGPNTSVADNQVEATLSFTFHPQKSHHFQHTLLVKATTACPDANGVDTETQ